MLWNPMELFLLLLKYRFIHFLAVGGSGVLINLFLTWTLTTYVFGLENYFTAYLFGLTANIMFSFTLYTVTVFQTKNDHWRRLGIYFVYILFVVWAQSNIIKYAVPLIGLQYYLLVIATVIAVFSIINFLVFKLSIFRQK